VAIRHIASMITGETRMLSVVIIYNNLDNVM